jgi:hypothetical protein
MKAILKTIGISLFMATSSIFTTSCEKDMMNSDNIQYATLLDVSLDGTSTVISKNMETVMVETPDLLDNELNSLLKMKEEEKLARDVYTFLYEKWGSTVFSRISGAENNHLNAIIRLLQYYGSADTLAGEAGIFANIEVQSLFNTLVAKGSESIEEAFKTGALIEEMDIKDLRDAIATTSNSNLIMVFENLERGSRNHLRAFNKQLTTIGSTYTPIYILQADYDQIVNSPVEKGNQYRMQGRGKGNGNCNGNGFGKRNGNQ